MGDYLLNVIMAAIVALPFMLLGGLIAELFLTRDSNRGRR